MLEEIFEILIQRREWFWELFVKHIALAGTCILLCVGLGLSLGIFISFHKRTASVILGLINVLYTIPDIAMFGFLIPITGIGDKTAIIALTVYGLLPMVRNTYTGLDGVSPSILEAAEGMGSTKMQTLFRVKLPLASMVILSGVRSTVVMTISIAGIASFIGAGGLGSAIYRGIATNNTVLMICGALLITVLAVLADCMFAMLEKHMKKRWKM